MRAWTLDIFRVIRDRVRSAVMYLRSNVSRGRELYLFIWQTSDDSVAFIKPRQSLIQSCRSLQSSQTL
jgi:hypothetical protein